jgi:hypothetical protein
VLSILAGLLAGASHVLSGPDHWIAVAPLSIARPARALKIGLRWGMGHGVGVLVIGALGISLRGMFSAGVISSAAEAMVGVVLVVSGMWALHRSRALVIHRHAHEHDHRHDETHEHVHLHVGDTAHDTGDAHRAHTHAAFGIGLLHGVAGAGPLWGLIPTLALPIPDAVGYLAAFVVSSVVTMMAFALFVAKVSQDRSAPSLNRAFALIGWGSIVFGVYWTAAAIMSA